LRTLLLAMILAPIAAGGASASTALPATSGLPGKYRQYSCDRLLSEGRAVSARAAALSGARQGEDSGAAKSDEMIVVPAVFDSSKRLDNSKQASDTLHALKKQFDAIQAAAIQSECEIEFVPSQR
jgi:hypothetical protein